MQKQPKALSASFKEFQTSVQNVGASTETPGLSMVPKLKYEHIRLTSFSKMRVDLAAEVTKFLSIVS